MPRRPGIRLFCAAVIVTATVAPAGLAQLWGVQAFSSLGDISSGGGQNNFTFDFSGGAGIPVAEVMIDDAVTTDSQNRGPWDRGTTHGFAGLSFSANHPPSLLAEAILTGNHAVISPPPAGAVALSGAFASDLFQFTGPAPTTLSLTFTLEGVVSDPPGHLIANSITLLDADVAVFADTPNYDFVGGVGSLLETGATLKQHGGVDALDLTTLNIDDDTGGATATRQTTLMFDVVPGETFYVHQVLEANAAYSTRLADAFSTLSSQFDQPQFVTSLSVPEPPTAVLLLMVIAWWRRRSR